MSAPATPPALTAEQIRRLTIVVTATAHAVEGTSGRGTIADAISTLTGAIIMFADTSDDPIAVVAAALNCLERGRAVYAQKLARPLDESQARSVPS